MIRLSFLSTLLLGFGSLILVSCSDSGTKDDTTQSVDSSSQKSDESAKSTNEPSTHKNMADNPFFNDYKTPFEMPPFKAIKMKHYKPAFEEGMKAHLADIDRIIQNQEKPSFANTIEMMERSGKLLNKVSRVYYNIKGAHTNPELQALEREMSPILSAHFDKISLNEKLFARINQLWQQRDSLGLDGVQQKLLRDTYKGFVRSGALLKGEKKEKLIAINKEVSELTVNFSQNLLAETNAFELVLDKKDLDGLPDDIIAAAASSAKEKQKKGASPDEKAKYKNKYVFTPHRSSMYPFLTYSTRRDLREQLYKAYINRGDNNNDKDNKFIVSRIAFLRAEKAKLLGYETHAHYVLEERMAKTPKGVYDLLSQLWKPALARAKQEVVDMQAMIEAEDHEFKLAGWDWWYYSEKVRQKKYALDEASIKPYLELDNVIDGAFNVAKRLWGLTFTERNDLPIYHPDVRVWEVKDKDGSHLGIYMADYFTRSTKRGGAWMSSYKAQSNLDGVKRPIIVNVFNFPPPVGDTPALLSFEHVTTLYHEFGHGLHGLVTNTKYPSQAGTSGPRDYTEFPAQIMEHWAGEPSVLKTYAKHYKTGEVMPDELIQKIQKSAKFNQGFANTEYLAASLLDMDWHVQSNTQVEDANDFENIVMNKYGLISEIAPRYRSTYFAHIFSSAEGYSAGYYAYIWSAVLDSDGFAAFKESGDLFNPTLAKKYREHILEKGSTEEAMTLYKKFRGREPKIDALLKVRGLDGSKD